MYYINIWGYITEYIAHHFEEDDTELAKELLSEEPFSEWPVYDNVINAIGGDEAACGISVTLETENKAYNEPQKSEEENTVFSDENNIIKRLRSNREIEAFAPNKEIEQEIKERKNLLDNYYKVWRETYSGVMPGHFFDGMFEMRGGIFYSLDVENFNHENMFLLIMDILTIEIKHSIIYDIGYIVGNKVEWVEHEDIAADIKNEVRCYDHQALED